MTKEQRIKDLMEKHGLKMTGMDGHPTEDIPAKAQGCEKLLEIYYVLKNTVDMENSYWFTRTWEENAGDVTIIRKAKAEAAALAHTTPTIQPYEKLVMQKTRNVRGAFPFPWVTASFFNAAAQALMNEVDAPAEAEADAVSVVGAGGGNVTKSYGNVISIAKKFGMRKEDVPVLVRTAGYWSGRSVEEVSDKYAQKTPNYKLYKDMMESVICMFDSFCIPQGREVMNYYLPLQYGWDGIIELCEKKQAETMGEANDEVLGMGRGYYYEAMKIMAQGMSKWMQNYADRAAYLASVETDAGLKKNYEDIAKVMGNIAHKPPATFREACK